VQRNDGKVGKPGDYQREHCRKKPPIKKKSTLGGKIKKKKKRRWEKPGINSTVNQPAKESTIPGPHGKGKMVIDKGSTLASSPLLQRERHRQGKKGKGKLEQSLKEEKSRGKERD